MDFFPYGKQHITQEDIDAVTAVLQSDFLTQGPKVAEFEKAIATYCGAKYAVAFNSGTSALHGAYFALELGEADQLITTPITFVATSNAALYLNATPVFVDVDDKTGNIDVAAIEGSVTSQAKIITPVHYGGLPVDMEVVQSIAKKHRLKVVEDGCHALGAMYKDTKVGSCTYSDITTFSFHPVKHITTGEGGIALTNDEALYQKMMQFRTHGIRKDNLDKPDEGSWYHEMHALGYNYRMTDIQAALGLSQLTRLDDFVTKRRQVAQWYEASFQGNEWFDIIKDSEGTKHAYHLFPILIKKKYRSHKKNIFEALKAQNLGVQVHYIPVYQQPYYRQHGFKNFELSGAASFYRSEISIPMYPDLEKSDVQEIAKRIMNVFNNTCK